MLAGFALNVSHQEIERILFEVEEWWNAAHDQAGVEWLPIDGVMNFLMQDLGYEDVDEFEDALQGSFADFLSAFPQVEVREVDERTLFKCVPQTPGSPRTLTLTVESSKQLLDMTFMKAADAELEIPAIEFAIGADHKRHIDSLYNHLAVAKENLEKHCASLGSDAPERLSILETIGSLSSLLDVEEPFELVVRDPRALSEFKPADGVRSAPMEA
uniref:Uncharacterized protein n=1 Tax=Zooxanthella nutricula TaxID=1333877 RepID=A0A6U6HLR3_9DINO